jgi:hypothetical protein
MDCHCFDQIYLNRLEHEWNVYVEPKSHSLGKVSDSSWLQSLIFIYKFQSGHEFWCWFNNSAVPSSFPPSLSSLRVFKSDCSPEKSDEDNILGGRLMFTVSKSVDEIWLCLLLNIISHDFPDNYKHMCGIVIKLFSHIQNIFRIEVWLKSGVTSYEVSRISEFLKSVLTNRFHENYSDELQISYQPHQR